MDRDRDPDPAGQPGDDGEDQRDRKGAHDIGDDAALVGVELPDADEGGEGEQEEEREIGQAQRLRSRDEVTKRIPPRADRAEHDGADDQEPEHHHRPTVKGSVEAKVGPDPADEATDHRVAGNPAG